MKTGTSMGELARLRYPDGMLIPFRADQLEMVADTQKQITAGSQTLFEATFLAEETLVKVDILTKLPGQAGWHLIEVKSSRRVKKEHIGDAAIQAYILHKSGLKIGKVSILHVNEAYRFPDEEELFKLTEVSDAVHTALLSIPAELDIQRNVLEQPMPPDIPLGRYCLRPEKCPFFDHCWQDIKKPTIYTINNLHKNRELELQNLNVFYLEDIPRDFPLSPKQRKQVDRINKKRVEVDQNSMQDKLNRLRFPIYFFDFETINPALPWVDGMASFEHMPFQFSLHILYEDGTLEHGEYLHLDRSDPHEPLAQSIIDQIGESGSIVVYHAAFEKRVLTALAERLPHFAERLLNMADRLWDLEKIFLEDYFHHRFLGKSSIKVVLPVLVPNLSYAGLAVQNGAEAQIAWLDMVDTPFGDEKEQKIEDLKAYCWQDTIAMVEIYRHLLGTVNSKQ
ncbi:MAG: DUF2779 domain-containing protein [Chloroflexota bacterium]